MSRTLPLLRRTPTRRQSVKYLGGRRSSVTFAPQDAFTQALDSEVPEPEPASAAQPQQGQRQQQQMPNSGAHFQEGQQQGAASLQQPAQQVLQRPEPADAAGAAGARDQQAAALDMSSSTEAALVEDSCREGGSKSLPMVAGEPPAASAPDQQSQAQGQGAGEQAAGPEEDPAQQQTPEGRLEPELSGGAGADFGCLCCAQGPYLGGHAPPGALASELSSDVAAEIWLARMLYAVCDHHAAGLDCSCTRARCQHPAQHAHSTCRGLHEPCIRWSQLASC